MSAGKVILCRKVFCSVPALVNDLVLITACDACDLVVVHIIDQVRMLLVVCVCIGKLFKSLSQ